MTNTKIINLDLQSQLIYMTWNKPKLKIEESTGKKILYLNDSKTWYITPSQAREYLSSHDDPKYADKMLGPEYNLLGNNLETILNLVPDEFTYVDFGPGLAKKSHLILKGAKNVGKIVDYAAIDISDLILETAANTLSDLELDTSLFLGDFADKGDLVLMFDQLSSKPKFVYLGATLSNYDTDEMLTHLSSRLCNEDFLYISMQERPEDIDYVIKQYETNAYTDGLAEGVRQLGFDSSKMKVRFNEETFDVENYLVVEKIPPLLKELYLCEGDEIVFFTSKKPTREYFQERVSKVFDGEYIIENGFLAFVGKKK